MIEKLQTEVKINPLSKSIDYKSRILLLGSCFADNIGKVIVDKGFNTKTNPFGTLYNPASINSSLLRLKKGNLFTENDIIKSGEIYTSLYHHSSYSHINKPDFLDLANSELKSAIKFLEESTDIIISLGSARIYKHIEKNIIASNCHKLNKNDFEERILSVTEAYNYLKEAIETIPNKRWVFTVSPIRHLKDGLHQNQLSKSTLLLAVDMLCKEKENCFYFPAYEIFMDELRDYRFYAEDMCHPSEQSINYIWRQFCNYAVNKETMQIIDKVTQLKNAMNHRPLFPESSTWQSFQDKLQKDLDEFRKEYPEIII